MIKAVFFDAIKTIFAPYPSEVELYKQAIFEIAGKNLGNAEIEAILKQAIAETESLDSVKNNSIQQWEHYPTRVAELVGCPLEECKDLGTLFKLETWGKPEKYRLYYDVLETLSLLDKRGVQIVCASNEELWLYDFFDHFNLRDRFKNIIISQEIGVEKPNIVFFEKALELTGFQAGEVLFVGDSLVSDYRGSQAAGMKSLLIDRDGQNTDNNVVAISDLTKVLEYL